MDDAGLFKTQRRAGDYRALFDRSQIPMALASMQGEPHLVAASRGFLDTFDLRRSAVVGRSLDDMLVMQGGGLTAAISRCLLGEESVRINVEVRGHGSRRFIGLVAHPAQARGFNGHVVLEAVGRGHAVHSFAQRLSSLFDQAGGDGRMMTYVHDLRSHRLRYVDGGLAQRFGLIGQGLRFQDFAARVHPDDIIEHSAYAVSRDALSDDEFTTQTVRVRDRHDEWRLLSLRSRVLRRDRDGAVRLLLGTATDITDYAAAAVEAAGLSVLRTEENERARIGRELHDSTTQHLVAADLGLLRTLRTIDLPADERVRLQGVQQSVSAAQTEIRAFAYFLHPPELRELGLLRTLARFCAGFARRSELQITFESVGIPDDLSSDTEHALFRVCQEALMNVYRHAFARRVTVRLHLLDGDIVLEVRDDGIGVDGIDRFEHGGMGVAGMRSRMRSVGGELLLDYLGPGLLVTARAPSLVAGLASSRQRSAEAVLRDPERGPERIDGPAASIAALGARRRLTGGPFPGAAAEPRSSRIG